MATTVGDEGTLSSITLSSESPYEGSMQELLRMEANMGLVGSRFLLAAGIAGGPRSTARYKRGLPKKCYQNAFELATNNPDLTYCEGRAVGAMFPVEHAWCIDAQGRVVDNTWIDGDAQQAYFGAAFKTDFLLGWVERQARYGVLCEMFPRELLELDPRDYLQDPSHEVVAAVDELAQDVLRPKRRRAP